MKAAAISLSRHKAVVAEANRRIVALREERDRLARPSTTGLPAELAAWRDRQPDRMVSIKVERSAAWVLLGEGSGRPPAMTAYGPSVEDCVAQLRGKLDD